MNLIDNFSNSNIIKLLNQLINIFWTAFAFTPVLWFWIKIGVDYWLYIFLILGFVFSILPQKVLIKLHIGSSRRIYERCGVKTIRKYVQDGDWVNSLNKKPPSSRFDDVINVKKYLTTIAMYERFHWFCFIFFLGSAIYAFFLGLTLFGIWLTAVNVIYNITSILLQQYNRIRIDGLIKKHITSLKQEV